MIFEIDRRHCKVRFLHYRPVFIGGRYYIDHFNLTTLTFLLLSHLPKNEYSVISSNYFQDHKNLNILFLVTLDFHAYIFIFPPPSLFLATFFFLIKVLKYK